MDLYSEIFDAYIHDLRIARDDANRWWVALLERERAVHGDATEAASAVRERWPLGPATHPRVLAVYRRYYLAVDAVNQALYGEDDEVPRAHPLDADAWRDDDEGLAVQHPRSVLYERLDEVDPSLARFMDSVVFVPIGADRDGRLV